MANQFNPRRQRLVRIAILAFAVLSAIAWIGEAIVWWRASRVD